MSPTHTVDEVELAQRIAQDTLNDPECNLEEALKILKNEKAGSDLCRIMVNDFFIQQPIHGKGTNLNVEILRKKLIELLEK